jgi:large repetitive protein
MGKKILLILLALILLISIPLTLFVLNKNQELRQKAAAATTMQLLPAQLTKKIGDEFSLDAVVDTGPNAVQEVLVEVEYDATKLKALSLTNSATFPNIIASENITDDGKASIAVGTASIAQPFSGTATAVTIRFQALAGTGTTPAKVSFSTKTFVGSTAEGKDNALIGSDFATITITGAQGDSSGAATPTPTKVVTPTPTVHSTATSQTITPTSTPLVTVTPTTSLAQASGSAALTITRPADNDVLTSSRPTFSGTATGGSTITITVYPTTITAIVTASTTGSWTYTPTVDLTNGAYTLTATISDPLTGLAANKSVIFAVGNATAQTTLSATQSATPVTGSIQTTITLLAIGIVFLVIGGIIIPVFTL